MNKTAIDTLLKARILRVRQVDKARVKSMVDSSETNAQVVKSLPLSEDSATVIFTTIYESIRQLGEAKWWLLNYEPANHEISLTILKDMEIKESAKLNFLDRFRKIRHDANYQARRATVPQAREILEFWDSCGEELIKCIKKEL